MQLGLVKDEEAIKSSNYFEKINLEARVKHVQLPLPRL